jgi:hypothetical protein
MNIIDFYEGIDIKMKISQQILGKLIIFIGYLISGFFGVYLLLNILIPSVGHLLIVLIGGLSSLFCIYIGYLIIDNITLFNNKNNKNNNCGNNDNKNNEPKNENPTMSQIMKSNDNANIHSLKLQKPKQYHGSDKLPTAEEKISNMYDDARNEIKKAVREALLRLERMS